MFFFQVEIPPEVADGDGGGVVEGDLFGSCEDEIFGDLDTDLE